MAKAIVIMKMVQDGENRGKPDVPQEFSFVHIGGNDLPDDYKAYVIAGKAADVDAAIKDKNCMASQSIGKEDEKEVWADASTKLVSDNVTTINSWLSKNDCEAIKITNSLEDVIKMFVPKFVAGADDIHDNN